MNQFPLTHEEWFVLHGGGNLEVQLPIRKHLPITRH